MDAVAIEAKEQHTASRPRQQHGPRTQMQTAMEINAFAQALTTPVRQCHLTGVKLPSHFLIPFTASIPAHSTAGDDVSNASRFSNTAFLVPGAQATTPGELRSNGYTYALAKRGAVEFVTARKRHPMLANEALRRWMARRAGRAVDAIEPRKDIKWDSGMAQVILEQLRETVADELAIGLRHKFVIPLEQLSGVQSYDCAHADVGARGEDRARSVVKILLAMKAGAKRDEDARGIAFEGVHLTHDLAQLLGHEQVPLANLRAPPAMHEQDTRWLGVLENLRSMKLRLALMRLAGYMRPKDEGDG
ncbi:hypothetical protein LTR53_007533 [Teratosphaeriaceae sp. CCFEE 6253]|nr:hypothetical protein LTR53_007533 [Teratosphaeriaceae sp. CCFEE 6253]